MRDQNWLNERLEYILKSFPEIQEKDLSIIFKGKWKTKFGHIKKKKSSSEIAVNGLFKDLQIPDFIIDLTIAHELVHYYHGFQSPLPKKFKYPHKHGIVKKELIQRGLKDILKKERTWVKNNWIKTYKELTSF